jgi:multidrug efflux pump subunit AcrA (membrane-fusion protein)
LEIGSRNAVQTLRNRQRLLEAQRASLSQGIQLTRRRLEQAELDLRRTRIEAPFDGMIDDEMIEKDSFVQPGSPLVRMEDLAAVEVSCRLRPDQIFWIWQSPGASAKPEIDAVAGAMRYELPRVRASVIYSLAGKKFVWQGQLSRYEGVGLDPQTRTIPCRILVPHADQGQALTAANSLGSAALPPQRLMNGMFVTVQLHVQPRMQLAAIPRQALRLGNVVWRVKDGRLSIIPVRVAKIVGENALLEIDPAIHFGEQVITSPLAFVEDGLQVEIRSPDTPPQALAAEDADADTRASKTEGITEPL